jgi:cell division protein FtsI/penicillin-binding protein 2
MFRAHGVRGRRGAIRCGPAALQFVTFLPIQRSPPRIPSQSTACNLESSLVKNHFHRRLLIPAIIFFAIAITMKSSEKSPSHRLGFQTASTFQQSVDRALEKHPGTFVIAEVTSGKIIASNNLRLAATTLQTPGSTLKPFVLMSLLELNRVDPAQKLICRRKLQIGSVHLDCTHPISVAQLDSDDAIAYSCNSYFAQVSIRLTSNELVQTFRRAGFDSPTGLTENDVSGRIRPPSNNDQIQLEALGADGIEITPLELLEAYRKLALRKRNGDIGKDAPVFDGLEHSVAYGMARAANVDDMKVAGKTGTAASRTNPRTHGFFVGYAPADKPEIAIVVFVQQGNGADAAAIAQSAFALYARENRAK